MSSSVVSSPHDWPNLVNGMTRFSRLKTTPVGTKLFERIEDMQAIPQRRRLGAIHTTDQIVAKAVRLGFTIGITREDLVVPHGKCKAVAVNGLRYLIPWHGAKADARAGMGANYPSHN